MDSRSQSALEFLMTYGWAFMAVLIMIGALVYFGVLDPSRFFPSERCDFGSSIGCDDNQFYIKASMNELIVATLTNNLGYDIMVYGANPTITVDEGWLNSNHDFGRFAFNTNLCFANMSATQCNNPDSSGDGTDDVFMSHGKFLWNGCDANVLCGGSGIGQLLPGESTLWEAGKPMKLIAAHEQGQNLEKGKTIKFLVYLKYYPANSDPMFSHDITGMIQGKVK